MRDFLIELTRNENFPLRYGDHRELLWRNSNPLPFLETTSKFSPGMSLSSCFNVLWKMDSVYEEGSLCREGRTTTRFVWIGDSPAAKGMFRFPVATQPVCVRNARLVLNQWNSFFSWIWCYIMQEKPVGISAWNRTNWHWRMGLLQGMFCSKESSSRWASITHTNHYSSKNPSLIRKTLLADRSRTEIETNGMRTFFIL